jgi:hypothetical protein
VYCRDSSSSARTGQIAQGWIRNERTVILFRFPTLELPVVGTADAASGTRRAVNNLKNNIVAKGCSKVIDVRGRVSLSAGVSLCVLEGKCSSYLAGTRNIIGVRTTTAMTTAIEGIHTGNTEGSKT